jgi:hypothetical protein
VSASLLQGAFYVTSGLWPIVHYRSFEAVTGPKTDTWLVKTIGGLISAVGMALLAGSDRDRATRVLGIGSALALAASSVTYSLKGRVSKVYLLDAAVEAGTIGLWAASIRSRRRLC